MTDLISKEEYVKKYTEAYNRYLSNVQSGKVIVSKYIQQNINTHFSNLKRKDLTFKLEEFRRVLSFFSFLIIQDKNEFKQFPLADFQAFILADLFGFYYSGTNKRKHNEAFIFTAKKSGKTKFAAALQLLGLMGEGTIGAQSILVAGTREQAKIALDSARDIISKSPALRKRLDVQKHLINYQYKGVTSFMKTMVNDYRKLNGLGSSFALVDEYHIHTDERSKRNIKSGQIFRENPMLITTTTAGYGTDSPCYEELQYAKDVLNGDIQNDNYAAYLYTLDDNDNYEDPDNWYKSNPNIGQTISIEKLKEEFENSKHRPTAKREFLTSNLNLFLESTTEFLESEAYSQCMLKIIEKELEGKDCYAAIDLSSTTDLSSLSLTFHNNELDYFTTLNFQYATQKTPNERKGGYKIKRWIDKGWIHQSQGKTIDYNHIFNHIHDLSERFNIVSFGYDKFNSALLIPRIQSELDIYCEEFRQTALEFNAPIKYFEKLIYDQKINVSKNPVTKWNFKNVVLWQDGNGNIKFLKNKSLDSIDGAVSTVMSLGMWMRANLDLEAMSIQGEIEAYQ